MKIKAIQLNAMEWAESSEVLIPGDVEGEYCFVVTLVHELLGITKFDVYALEECRDLIDQRIKVLRAEIPDTNALLDGRQTVADWWTKPEDEDTARFSLDARRE